MDKKRSVNLLMLIDDNKIDTFVNEKIIKIASFASELLVMNSAMEALTYIKDRQHIPDQIPDVLFLDLNMPVMNGFRFLEEFSKLSQTVLEKSKVFVLSSSDSVRDKEMAMGYANVIGYLSKPLSTEKLELMKKMMEGVSNK